MHTIECSTSAAALETYFPQLLAASPYVTTNANEADYFYGTWLPYSPSHSRSLQS